jgi:hypothetical protein
MSHQTYAYFKQWRLDKESGKGPRMVPSGPTTEHIRSLVAAGASQAGVARAAGISAEAASRLLHRPRASVQLRTERRVLAVTLDDVLRRRDPQGFVPAIGARRRIQALLAMGWTHKLITEHMTGCRQISHVALNQRGTWIARATHDAVVAAYEELCMTPGPSDLSRRRAIDRGYAPPLAWDEGAIDDPEATPDLGESQRAPGRPGVDLEEWALLVRTGESPERAAERCGVTITAVSRAAYRAGRRDLAIVAERVRNGMRSAA